MKKLLFLLLASSTLLGLGCNKDDQAVVDRDTILQYISDNNLDAIEDESGLFYVIETPGGEEKPLLSDEVEVKYRGYFTNGDTFDGTNVDGTTPNRTIEFPLTNVIAGWQIGIPKFGRSGSGILLIPSNLGYGSSGRGSVPGNTVMVFDIELVGF